MKLPGYVKEIIEIYHRAGYEAFVVGGCVRDYLLGKEPHDYDIATNALPEVTIQLFDHVILTGLKHGTVTILSNEPVEVTTFRLESEYNVEIRLEQLPYEYIRWIENKGEIDPSKIQGTSDMKRIKDLKGNPLLLFINSWSVGMVEERNPNLKLSEFGRE